MMRWTDVLDQLSAVHQVYLAWWQTERRTETNERRATEIEIETEMGTVRLETDERTDGPWECITEAPINYMALRVVSTVELTGVSVSVSVSVYIISCC